MPVPTPRRGAKQVNYSAAITDAANSLAERDYTGRIKLSPEVVRLVKAIISNRDAAGIAEELERADNRGALRLLQQAAALVEEVLVAALGEAGINRESAAKRESRGTEVLRGKAGRFAGRRRI